MYVQFFNFLIYILILSQSIYENEYDTVGHWIYALF